MTVGRFVRGKKNMENELEKALCVEIAARSPFNSARVYSAWETCKSFDVLIKAVDLCAALGLQSIVIPGARPTLREPDKSHTHPGAGGSE